MGMCDRWLREYVLLAFRIHRVVQTTYGDQFVEAYYGPPAWRQLAEYEPEMAAEKNHRNCYFTD